MLDDLRDQFPALRHRPDAVFLDGPAGTQVPQVVIDAISRYYVEHNANSHGAFITSRETDAVIEGVRDDLAAFLGAEGPHTISLGQNMTSLCYALSTAVARRLQPGDEILITQLDHEANRGPWLSQRERGIVVREVALRKDGRLDYEDLKSKLNERTRLVAMGYASNLLGTVNDVALVRRLTYRFGSWLLLDAVHAAPHFPIDVQALGCDFLLCSAYKFYGPHVGILYSRPGLLDRLQPDRLRTTDQHAPFSIEMGTLNHAALAGVSAAIHWIASLGEGEGLRRQLVSAMERIREHEQALAKDFYETLIDMPGLEVLGPTFIEDQRAPTLALSLQGKHPRAICEFLAKHEIYGWHGHFYALRGVEVLGLHEQGGVTRLGLSAYSHAEDVSRCLKVLDELVN